MARMPSLIKIAPSTMSALRVMRYERRRLIVRSRGREWERAVFVTGPGNDFVHRRAFEALKKHRIIALAKRGHLQYEYDLTDFGKLLFDDRPAFMRRYQEAKNLSTHGHVVDPSTMKCVRCGKTKVDILRAGREGGQKCVPPTAEEAKANGELPDEPHIYEVGHGGP